jgi:hypothetical protein
MKQTAIQQAIVMVRNRMESMNDTLMGKHTAHHLQQIERGLYELLEAEKEQSIDFAKLCLNKAKDLDVLTAFINSQKYYNETYGKDA